MLTILILSAKMATPSLLKVNVFSNKGYDAIIHVHDITNKFWSSGLNCIVDLFMWPKFSNCNISMRKVIITSII